MTLVPTVPIAEMHGKLLGMNSRWHVRTNRYGTIYTARNGNPQKNPTAKQLAQQDKMRHASLHYKWIVQNEKELAHWREAFKKQRRYKLLRQYIIGELMRAEN